MPAARMARDGPPQSSVKIAPPRSLKHPTRFTRENPRVCGRYGNLHRRTSRPQPARPDVRSTVARVNAVSSMRTLFASSMTAASSPATSKIAFSGTAVTALPATVKRPATSRNGSSPPRLIDQTATLPKMRTSAAAAIGFQRGDSERGLRPVTRRASARRSSRGVNVEPGGKRGSAGSPATTAQLPAPAPRRGPAIRGR